MSVARMVAYVVVALSAHAAWAQRGPADQIRFDTSSYDADAIQHLAREAWRRTGRDVMTVHYSAEELDEKASDPGAFVDRVLSGQLTFIKGRRG